MWPIAEATQKRPKIFAVSIGYARSRRKINPARAGTYRELGLLCPRRLPPQEQPREECNFAISRSGHRLQRRRRTEQGTESRNSHRKPCQLFTRHQQFRRPAEACDRRQAVPAFIGSSQTQRK